VYDVVGAGRVCNPQQLPSYDVGSSSLSSDMRMALTSSLFVLLWWILCGFDTYAKV
jgi:hypothetical protein